MTNRSVRKIWNAVNYLTSLGGHASLTLTRFLRFGTSSSFTLIIDILLLAFFVEILLPESTAEINYLIGSGMSFLISTSINYFINRNWGFRGTVTGVLKGYTLFLLFSIFGIALTIFLMWVFVYLFSFYYLLARVVVAMIEGSLTFVVNSIFTFKMSELPKMLALKKEFEKGNI